MEENQNIKQGGEEKKENKIEKSVNIITKTTQNKNRN